MRVKEEVGAVTGRRHVKILTVKALLNVGKPVDQNISPQEENEKTLAYAIKVQAN